MAVALPANERAHAQRRFYSIIDHYGDHIGVREDYSRHLLIRYTYEFSRSESSKDTLLYFHEFTNS